MDPTTEPDSGAVREAASAAMASDPVTADLLKKHSAGEKLTASEYGKLGAFAKGVKKFFGKGDAAPGPSQPGAETRLASPVAAGAPAEASPDSVVDPAIDAGLVQRTTSTLLSRCESIAQSYVGKHARAAGAEGATLDRLTRAACFKKDDKALMVEISPDVAASLGVNPRHYPVAVFCGCLGLWATDLWLAVNELKQLRKPQDATPEKVSGAVRVYDPPSRELPTPKPPKGSPPEFT